ncbi:molybdenum cofactor biosynthesis protein 1 [Vanessa cardui]|uniref:molybdenum cofactor biosynthesis protein 1 n=1 Tax=Vanessa cardui TaxID=171605 RepID=UPI001F13E453|nr:molybdenum cofactor biosynthesis protein 1 [Vanessa cardui]
MAYNNKMKLIFGTKSFTNGRTFSNRFFNSQRLTHTNIQPDTQSSDSKVAPLVDLYGRQHNYLRISLTERCNLRCQYCMPAEGVPLSARDALLTRAELLRLVHVFAALGVTKLRLTGGEPSVRSDLVDIVQELSGVPGVRTLAMTSNGLALLRRLPALQRAGLRALNLSLDSLRPERFESMARRPGLPRVLASMDLALQLGFDSVKVNTVLMKGFNDDEVSDFVELTRERKIDVRFIEFMPFSGNRWQDERLVSERDALAAARRAHPRLARDADDACRTATMWRVPGYAGRVGFISSMTKPFCSTCNRLRLTADGNLKVCLFGEAETSLREALRGGASDADLEALVRAALRRKLPQHAAARPDAPRRALARNYCTSAPEPPAPPAPPARRRAAELTHLDEHGRARMVDVGEKPVTARAAEAECFLVVGARLLRLLRSARLPKGDALTVAQVAGALAAKRTADLIPLCHPLPLELAHVRVTLPRAEGDGGGRVRVWCEARATARTGVEMEALTGCAVAALALYDMCKSVDKGMSITELRVVRKSGGSSSWPAEGGGKGGEGPHVRAHDTSPLKPDETYAPTNFMYF